MKKIISMILLVLMLGTIFCSCSPNQSFSSEEDLIASIRGVWKYDSPSISGDTVYVFIGEDDEDIVLLRADDIQWPVESFLNNKIKNKESIKNCTYQDMKDEIISYYSERSNDQRCFTDSKKGTIDIFNCCIGYNNMFGTTYEHRLIINVGKEALTIQEDAAVKDVCQLEKVSDKITVDLPEFKSVFEQTLQDFNVNPKVVWLSNKEYAEELYVLNPEILSWDKYGDNKYITNQYDNCSGALIVGDGVDANVIFKIEWFDWDDLKTITRNVIFDQESIIVTQNTPFKSEMWKYVSAALKDFPEAYNFQQIRNEFEKSATKTGNLKTFELSENGLKYTIKIDDSGTYICVEIE